ncbi:MAG: polyprenyl synthetase family protein [Deltaproteobacteria bacterium]|nr:polyprenyl synthetase family protein [Deltaproteobacteria bacterium]
MSRPRLRRLAPALDPDALGAELLGFLGSIEGALGDLAGGDGAPPGFDPRLFLAPGLPRVRPLLVLLSARAAAAEADGGRPDAEHLHVAASEHLGAAAELLHVAVALHDAALGRQGGRRRRAARRLLSGAAGLLGGNHLTLRALELSRAGGSPEVVGDMLEAMREIGEAHAIAQRTSGKLPTPAEAAAVAEGHTGAVFAFACRAGARLAGGERRHATSLGRYGRHAGVAWQIAEEMALLDARGPDELAALEDRAERGRAGLALALAAAAAPPVGEAWARLGRQPSPERARALVELLHQHGALAPARERLVQESWKARTALHTLGPSASRDLLEHIVTQLGRTAPEGRGEG